VLSPWYSHLGAFEIAAFVNDTWSFGILSSTTAHCGMAFIGWTCRMSLVSFSETSLGVLVTLVEYSYC